MKNISSLTDDEIAKEQARLEAICVDLKQSIIDDDVKLLALNNRVRSAGRRLPPQEYKEICNKQLTVKTRMATARNTLSQLKEEKGACSNELNNRKYAIRKNLDLHMGTVERLDALQKKYSDFSGDTTRVASMRAMAASFAQEIRDIIKGSP